MLQESVDVSYRVSSAYEQHVSKSVVKVPQEMRQHFVDLCRQLTRWSDDYSTNLRQQFNRINVEKYNNSSCFFFCGGPSMILEYALRARHNSK